MVTIHCMCGYIGFGKTTISKELETKYSAKRFTPDELMVQLYGENIGTDFMEKAEQLNDYIWQEITKCIKNRQNVIYDTGSWTADDRKYVMQQAQKLNASVIWHQIQCSIETAKKRTLDRARKNKELAINEKFFDENLERYKPIDKSENLTVISHQGE